nr:hypothetical protein [Desulfobacterales bacterium]
MRLVLFRLFGVGRLDRCKIDVDADRSQDGTGFGHTFLDIGPDTSISVFQPDLDPRTISYPLIPNVDRTGLNNGGEDTNHERAIILSNPQQPWILLRCCMWQEE